MKKFDRDNQCLLVQHYIFLSGQPNANRGFSRGHSINRYKCYFEVIHWINIKINWEDEVSKLLQRKEMFLNKFSKAELCCSSKTKPNGMTSSLAFPMEFNFRSQSIHWRIDCTMEKRTFCKNILCKNSISPMKIFRKFSFPLKEWA